MFTGSCNVKYEWHGDFCVSHDVDFLARICDRIVLMQDGRIVGEREPSEFTHCCRSYSLFDQEAAQ